MDCQRNDAMADRLCDKCGRDPRRSRDLAARSMTHGDPRDQHRLLLRSGGWRARPPGRGAADGNSQHATQHGNGMSGLLSTQASGCSPNRVKSMVLMYLRYGRPPLVKDYFEPALRTVIRVPKRLRQIKVTVDVEITDIPEL